MLHETVPAPSSHVTASMPTASDPVSCLITLTPTLRRISICISISHPAPLHFTPSHIFASFSFLAAFASLVLVGVRLLDARGKVANVHKLSALQMSTLHGVVDTSA